MRQTENSTANSIHMNRFRIHSLVIDDEPVACAILQRMLSKEKDIVLMGSYTDSTEALEAARKLSPELLFLDIQMPELGGFELLKELSNEKIPYVIFVTAYEQFAAKAYNIGAIDYLLKPFDRKRLKQALERARHFFRANSVHALERSAPGFLDRLTISKKGDISFIKATDIDWIEAREKNVCLHCGKEKYLLRIGLSRLENQLNPHQFVRIHRSLIVNISRIEKIQAWLYGDYRITLTGGAELNLSRSYKQRLYQMIGKPIPGKSIG